MKRKAKSAFRQAEKDMYAAGIRFEYLHDHVAVTNRSLSECQREVNVKNVNYFNNTNGNKNGSF